MWIWSIIIIAAALALMGLGRWLDDTADEREDRRELNRRAREGHREAMNRVNGIQPSGARWNGACKYNKRGI